jgi:hypothetical protein
VLFVRKNWPFRNPSSECFNNSRDMVEEELKSALLGMLNAIDRTEGQDISDSLSTIDGILRKRKNELDAQLVHYLSRRSYEKALSYLEGSKSSRENP